MEPALQFRPGAEAVQGAFLGAGAGDGTILEKSYLLLNATIRCYALTTRARASVLADRVPR